MTLFDLLSEASVSYKIGSGRPDIMLYDFYVLGFISGINLSPEKQSTQTFGELGYQGGFSERSDRVKQDIAHANEVLLPVLKDKLLKGLFVSICAEIRHIKDRPQTYSGTPLAESKLFKKYYQYYTLLDKVPQELAPGRLREPKSAKPAQTGYLKSYQAAHRALKETNTTPEDFVKLCEYAFRNMSWSPSYGGKNWANICKGYLLLKDSNTTDKMSVAIDHVYDLEHNTGAALNKVKDFYITDKKGKEQITWLQDALDEKRDATNMKPLLNKCSSDMRKLAYQAMALSPIDYLKRKTPAPEQVMQQKAAAAGGVYITAFNQAAPEKYRVKTTKKEPSTFKKAPIPSDSLTPAVYPATNKTYFDGQTNSYVTVVSTTPSGNIDNSQWVKVLATTDKTDHEYLVAKIKDGNVSNDTYIALSGDLYHISERDKKNLIKPIADKPKEDNVDLSEVKVAPGPKLGLKAVTNYKEDNVYYDVYLKTYVYFVKYAPGSAVVVKLAAVTKETPKHLLKTQINQYNKGDNTYVSIDSDILNLSPTDIADFFNVEDPPKNDSDVEELKKNTIIAPLPVGSATTIKTFKDNVLYYDSKLSTYVFYEPKGGFTDYKVVSLYAATSETSWYILSDKINSYKKDTGKFFSYIAKGSDLLLISEYDKKAVIRAVQKEAENKQEKKKPSIELDVPTAPVPAGGGASVDTFVGTIYFDNNLKTYFTYITTFTGTDFIKAKLIAVTDQTDIKTLKAKINAAKEQYQSSDMYVVSKQDVLKISEYDKKVVEDIITNKKTPAKYVSIPENIWTKMSYPQKSKFLHLTEQNTFGVFMYKSLDNKDAGEICTVLGFDTINDTIIIKLQPYTYEGQKMVISNSVTLEASDQIKTISQAYEKVKGEKEYEAPDQKGSSLTYAPIVGAVYYDKKYSQFIQIVDYSNHGVYSAKPIAKTLNTPLFMRFYWNPYSVNSTTLELITQNSNEYITKYELAVDKQKAEERDNTPSQQKTDVPVIYLDERSLKKYVKIEKGEKISKDTNYFVPYLTADLLGFYVNPFRDTIVGDNMYQKIKVRTIAAVAKSQVDIGDTYKALKTIELNVHLLKNLISG
jgi:hypothetical protein